LFRGLAGAALALATVCLTFPAAAQAASLPAAAPAITLHRLEWSRSAAPVAASPVPAADDVAPAPLDNADRWVPFHLPLRWNTGPEAALQPVRMRMRFTVTTVPTDTWGVLISDTNEGGRLRLNGRVIGEIPAATEARAVSWLRPHIVAIDPSVLVAGENELLLESAVRQGLHTVGDVEVGPWVNLWNWYAVEFFVDYICIWIGLTVALVMGIAGGAAQLLRRMDGALLLVGASCAWMVHAVAQLFEVVPAQFLGAVRVADLAGLGAFGALLVSSLLRQCGLRRRLAEGLVAAIALLGPLLVSGTLGVDLLGAVHVWRLGLGAAVAGSVSFASLRRSRGLAAPGATVLSASILMAAALLADATSALGLSEGAESMLSGFAAPLMLAALTVPLAESVSRILIEAEASRDELELRVREREQLLKRNFERLRESERVKVEAKERQRIMQDMHDGLGSQLMSALMLVERDAVSSDQFAQILRESIDDMRLAIDALAAEEVDLAAALGNLRYRMEPRMRAAGIDLQWDARQLPDDVELHPDVVLPILRIVQEALTNALKHSRARRVKVAVGVESAGEASWLDIRVSDNGVGIDGERIGGRGLLNMRNRAQKITAQLRLESARGAGTSVHVRYRVVRAAAGPSSNTVLNTQAVIERVRQG
jgi:signal transduction histidine kinase